MSSRLLPPTWESWSARIARPWRMRFACCDSRADVREMLEDGRLSEGHARALLGVSDTAQMSRLARDAAANGWTVRDTESRVREGRAPRSPAPTRRSTGGFGRASPGGRCAAETARHRCPGDRAAQRERPHRAQLLLERRSRPSARASAGKTVRGLNGSTAFADDHPATGRGARLTHHPNPPLGPSLARAGLRA